MQSLPLVPAYFFGHFPTCCLFGYFSSLKLALVKMRDPLWSKDTVATSGLHVFQTTLTAVQKHKHACTIVASMMHEVIHKTNKAIEPTLTGILYIRTSISSSSLSSPPPSTFMFSHPPPFWKMMVTLAEALTPSFSTLWSFTSWLEPPPDLTDLELVCHGHLATRRITLEYKCSFNPATPLPLQNPSARTFMIRGHLCDGGARHSHCMRRAGLERICFFSALELKEVMHDFFSRHSGVTHKRGTQERKPWENS